MGAAPSHRRPHDWQRAIGSLARLTILSVVESVGADGTISTIEGGSSDSVARRTYGTDSGGAIGYVRLG